MKKIAIVFLLSSMIVIAGGGDSEVDDDYQQPQRLQEPRSLIPEIQDLWSFWDNLIGSDQPVVATNDTRAYRTISLWLPNVRRLMSCAMCGDLLDVINDRSQEDFNTLDYFQLSAQKKKELEDCYDILLERHGRGTEPAIPLDLSMLNEKKKQILFVYYAHLVQSQE